MTPLPNPRHLRYLCSLAETLHFGRAASVCGVTQSTLSAGIQELEALLGASLVERTKRRVLLTPLGHDVAARAQRILREAEDLVDLARSAKEPLSGELRLGVIPTIGPYLLPRALRRLQEAYPKLRLYLREEQTGPLIEQLGEGRLDALVLALPYDIGDLETMSLGKDELLLVCPASHALARKNAVATADLEGVPVLMLEDGHCLRSQSLRACQLSTAERHEVFQGTSLRTLVPMVENGLGVTLLPRMALETELPHDGTLVARKLATPSGAREIVLAWRRTSARAAEFRLLGEKLREALAAPSAVIPAESGNPAQRWTPVSRG
jgi:LysR family hydrogen peroxide-inducible transcriptional activator